MTWTVVPIIRTETRKPRRCSGMPKIGDGDNNHNSRHPHVEMTSDSRGNDFCSESFCFHLPHARATTFKKWKSRCPEAEQRLLLLQREVRENLAGGIPSSCLFRVREALRF